MYKYNVATMQTITLIDLEPDEDGQQRPPFEVPPGETVIGREPFLQCTHPGVSRSHAKLAVNENRELTLTSIHKKPSYYQRVGDPSKTVLALNESVTLHGGDMFYMIESGCGYRVQISGNSRPAETEDPPVEDAATEIPQSKKSPGKRKLPQWMVEDEEDAHPVQSSKKTEEKPASSQSPEPEEAVETETLEESGTDEVSAPQDVSDEEEAGNLTVAGGSEETGVGDDVDDAQQGTSATPPAAVSAPYDVNDGEETGSLTVAGGSDETGVGDDVDDAQQGTSATPPPAAQRQPCRYGSSCYRKNPQHRLDFSHPGDADYAVTTAPAPGTKPACPYGTSCYRRNPQHIQDYDHTQPPTATSPAKQGRKKRKAAGQKKNTGYYSGSDDSYESSFIGSSDEYSPDPNDDDDTDEDWD